MGGSSIPGKPTPPNMRYPTSPKACTSYKSRQAAAFILFACKNYNTPLKKLDELAGRMPASFFLLLARCR
jgi:hypothetical protein